MKLLTMSGEVNSIPEYNSDILSVKDLAYLASLHQTTNQLKLRYHCTIFYVDEVQLLKSTGAIRNTLRI